MATQSKSQFLNDVHTHLKKRYKPKPDRSTGRMSVLEAVVYGICHEDATREQANQALSRFKDEFFDWNEVRVSPISEVQGALADIPDPQGRAQRVRRFLRQLFEKTYGFNLEALAKKPLKEAMKTLQAYDAFHSDYVTATVIQQALGGHAIPIDASTQRVLGRLGISEPDVATLRGVLERAVPKNRGVEFIELLESLAHDTCVEGVPECPRCELRKLCPYAIAKKYERPAAEQMESSPKPSNARATGKAASSGNLEPASSKKAAPEARKEPEPAPPTKKASPKSPPPPSPPTGKRGKPK